MHSPTLYTATWETRTGGQDSWTILAQHKGQVFVWLVQLYPWVDLASIEIRAFGT